MGNLHVATVKLAFHALSSGSVKMVCFAVIACFAVVFYVLTIRATFQVSYTFSPQYIPDVVARDSFKHSVQTFFGHSQFAIEK
jgi:hypothetical protein